MAPPLVIRDKALVAIIIFTVKPQDRLRSVRRMTLLSCSFGKRYVSALSIRWWYGSIRIGSGGAAGWLYIRANNKALDILIIVTGNTLLPSVPE